jgi:hypothetical protein
MKFSDLLRQAANALDSASADAPKQQKMMPPQTQELELTKKMAGVPSEYDNMEPEVEVSDCGCGSDQPSVELMASQDRDMKYPENRAVTEPTGDSDEYPPVVMPSDAMGTGDDLTEPTGDIKKYPKVKEDNAELDRVRRLAGL